MKQSKFYQIKNITEHEYTLVGCDGSVITLPIQEVDKTASAFTIQDAKDGDVLACNEEILLFKSYSVQGRISLYCWYNEQTNNFHSKEVVDTLLTTKNNICPATKEQRDTLFAKMKEAGYDWSEEAHELKEINNEEIDGEDYGIDSLWHAQRILEKTLGKVEGYQSDDGVLEHKCAISAVKKLYEQNPAWSEEDKEIVEALNDYVKNLDTFFSEIKIGGKDITSKEFREKVQHWLKSLNPQSQWKPSDEQMYNLSEAAHYRTAFWDCDILIGLYDELKKLREV